MKFLGSILTYLPVLGFCLGNSGAAISINEIRIDQPGSDHDEYIELYSDIANATLEGLTLIVIGDGASALGDGVIEEVVELSGNFDGHFYLIAESAFGLAAEPDLRRSLNFENSDNVTFFLVSNFSGAIGDDIDSEDSGVPDFTPWEAIVDGVALIEDAAARPGDTELEYASVYGFGTVGPGDPIDGRNAPPGHAYRETDGVGAWLIGEFSTDAFESDDTPRGTNNPQDEFALVFGAATIAENAGSAATTLTIILDEPFENPLTIYLEVDDPSEVSLPSTVTVPALMTEVTLDVDAVDDLWADGTQTVTLIAKAPGFFPTVGVLEVTDDGDESQLVVNEVYAAAEIDVNGDGIASQTADEFVEIVNASEAAIDLGGYTLRDLAALNGLTAAQHVFPDGTVLQEGRAIVVFGGGEGLQEGPNANFGGAIIQIRSSSQASGLDLDNNREIVSLQNPAGVEVAGAVFGDTNGLGAVTRDPDIVGEFTTSFPTPGYRVDGTTPFGDPLPILSVAVVPNPALEGGPEGTVTVTSSTVAPGNVEVALVSSDTTEATVQATATILQGTDSVTAAIQFPDDAVPDGPVDVTITASAPGYLSGQTVVTVEDDGADGGVPGVQGDLVINEFLHDPAPGADVSGDGTASVTQDEFVELVNVTGSPMDISGWTVSDAVGVRHTFADGTVIAPSCAVVVFGGGGPPVGDFGGALVVRASGGQLALNNGGDTITIADSEMGLVSEVEYGNDFGDESYNLNPDLVGSGFVAHSSIPGSVGFWSPGTHVDGMPFCDPGGGYATFAMMFPGLGAAEDDDDFDGIPNLIEYALGLDPTMPDTGGLPVVGTDGMGRPQLTVAKGALAGADANTTFSVTVSTELAEWTTVDTVVLSDTPDELAVVYVGGEDRIFMRLEVTEDSQ
ncbi:hypothetical protein BH23VER1_BH23VER1_12360 [soil metagenome]